MRSLLLVGWISISGYSGLAQMASMHKSDQHLMQVAAHIWAWYKYWLPNDYAMSTYPVGKNVRISTAYSSAIAGFCSPDLQLCMLFAVQTNGDLVASSIIQMSKEPSNRAVLRFLEEQLNLKLTGLASANATVASKTEKHTFDPRRLDQQKRLPAPSPSFIENQFVYNLPPLKELDKSLPPDLNSVKNLSEKMLRVYFPVAKCPIGQTTIPFYSDSDPRLYISADFGKCGDGVLMLDFVPNVGWTLNKFLTSRDDVLWFSGRIRGIMAVEAVYK